MWLGKVRARGGIDVTQNRPQGAHSGGRTRQSNVVHVCEHAGSGVGTIAGGCRSGKVSASCSTNRQADAPQDAASHPVEESTEPLEVGLKPLAACFICRDWPGCRWGCATRRQREDNSHGLGVPIDRRRTCGPWSRPTTIVAWYQENSDRVAGKVRARGGIARIAPKGPTVGGKDTYVTSHCTAADAPRVEERNRSR